MNAVNPQQMKVASDHDLILLRQAVRNAARSAGLGSAQQARFTAAISEVARALIAGAGESSFTIGLSQPPARDALEVCCLVRGDHLLDPAALYGSASVAGARTLVDDAQLDQAPSCLQLMLRMWLAH
jgi:anti-sigma regulatory factor (Ser/Thr protein kinase)